MRLGAAGLLAVLSTAACAGPVGPVEWGQLPAGGGILLDTGSAIVPLTIGSGLTLSGTTLTAAGGAGTGTVTSVGLALPSLFTVSGSPVTSAGTLSAGLASQAANTVLAAPSGAAGVPGFRALVGADLPAPSATSLGGVESVAPAAHQFVTGISTAGVPSLGQPAIGDISGAGALASAGYPAAGIVTSTGAALGTLTVGPGLTLTSGTLSASVTSVFGRTGAVTLGSADVTGALGFTPFSSAGGPISGPVTVSAPPLAGYSYSAAGSIQTAQKLFDSTPNSATVADAQPLTGAAPPVAQSFTVPAYTRTQPTSVVLNLVGGGGSGSFTVSLAPETQSGAVGPDMALAQVLATVADNTLPSGVITAKTISLQTPDLPPAHRYWLVLQPAPASTTSWVYQSTALDGGGIDNIVGEYSYTSGTAAQTSTLPPYSMSLLGTLTPGSVFASTGEIDDFMVGLHLYVPARVTSEWSPAPYLPGELGYNTTTGAWIFGGNTGWQSFLPTTGGTLSGPLIGTSGSFSLGLGTTPIAASEVTGVLPAANGGTGAASLAAAAIPVQSGTGTTGDCVKWASATSITDAGAACGVSGGAGTVTSVALALPSLFTVSGSPVTSSGTLTGTLASQTANTVLAAPNGSAGVPGFRALVGADLPAPSASTLGGIESVATVAHQFVTGISAAGVPSLAQPAAADVSGLAASATTDTTNATNIASGTLSAARLPASGVTAGSCGSSTTSCQLTVDATGRVTAQSSATIAGGGGSAAIFSPQGRLTLTSGSPVMTADVVGATTIYYDDFHGNAVPIYNGTASAMYPITGGELSLALNATDEPSGALYDVFAVNVGGSATLCAAPDWSSTTARSVGVNLTVTGYWTNAAPTVHCYAGATDEGAIAANQGTYLGTFYATAAGATTMQFQPVAAPGGSGCTLGLFNSYNQVALACTEIDSNSTWTSSSTWGPADASAANSATWVDGLRVVQGTARLTGFAAPVVTGDVCDGGLQVDADSGAPPATSQIYLPTPYNGPIYIAIEVPRNLGLHKVYAMNAHVTGSNSCMFWGNPFFGLTFRGAL